MAVTRTTPYAIHVVTLVSASLHEYDVIANTRGKGEERKQTRNCVMAMLMT